jgi:N-acetyl-gamma-glutamylphosphate reductase
MLEIGIVAWTIGMTGLLIIRKMSKHKKVEFWDVKDKVRKFKKVKDDITASTNIKLFK